MTLAVRTNKVQLLNIGEIHVLNPRTRNQKVFVDLTNNIAQVGLKRPITVTSCRSGAPGKLYDLVCGQGRLEAFQACGQIQIPSIIVDATEEQALIMSLVENLARRQHRAVELLDAIEILSRQNYNALAIAKKTGLSEHYVGDVLTLMRHGEERLIAAVEAGKLPIYLAVRLAEHPEAEQRVLQDAYESGQLRGNRLLIAKKLVDRRHRYGKSFSHLVEGKRQRDGGLSVQDVVKAFQREMDRKRLLARKADRVTNNLLFITEALRSLLQDENFHTLLRAEGLNTLPKPLLAMINKDAA